MGNLQTNAPAIDQPTGAPYRVDYAHHEIHTGSAYLITRVLTLADGGSDEVLITTPAGSKHAHMRIFIQATGQTDAYVYEGTTRAGGTSITPRNRNRNYADASTLSVSHTPSGGAEGTVIEAMFLGLDTSTGQSGQIGGGSGGGRAEIVLKSGTSYLIAIDSATADNRVTLVMDWYEHTDKTI